MDRDTFIRMEQTMDAMDMFEGLSDGLTRKKITTTDGQPIGWYMHSIDSLETYPVRLIDGELVAFGAARGPFVVHMKKVYRDKPTPRVMGQHPTTAQPLTLAEEGWVAPTPHSPECPYTNTSKAVEIANKIRQSFGAGKRTKDDAIYWYCGCSTHYPLGKAVADLLTDLPDTGFHLA